MTVKPRAFVANTHCINRGRNSALKEIKAYLNGVAYERYTKQSKLTDYFTQK